MLSKHCVSCESENIIKVKHGYLKWDLLHQQWEYKKANHIDPTFYCFNCDTESLECTEKELEDANS